MGYGYYPTDKGTTHCYIDTYDRLFASFQDQEINILEVGVSEGGSIRLFSDYFTKANIYGYDIMNTARPGIFGPHVTYIIKDINKVDPQEFINIAPTIAIDDGSHILADQLLFVKLVYPAMVEGGLLFIEDIQDIDKEKTAFEALGFPMEVIDLRSSGRYDDVLILFKK